AAVGHAARLARPPADQPVRREGQRGRVGDPDHPGEPGHAAAGAGRPWQPGRHGPGRVVVGEHGVRARPPLRVAGRGPAGPGRRGVLEGGPADPVDAGGGDRAAGARQPGPYIRRGGAVVSRLVAYVHAAGEVWSPERQPPPEVAAIITNPAAWEDGAPPPRPA